MRNLNVIDLVRYPKLVPELLQRIKSFKYEITEGGQIFVPKAKVALGGFFDSAVIRAGKMVQPWCLDPNLMVNQGLDSILDVQYSAATQITIWYIGIFEGNYTPLATDTAANIATNSTESTAYTETVRQTWTEAGVSSQSITNSASKATFSINATKTIYGAFQVSSDVKSGTSGTLSAASKFAASRSVVNLDSLLVTYSITAADA